MKKSASTPKNLSSEAKSLWRKLTAEYGIDDEGGFQILRVGLEAFERMRACQAQIELAGMTTLDRFGQLRANPLLTTERDCRAQFLAALKALNLDLEPLHARPGRPGGS
jgi:P27 family predicted phage terminase small subunit